MNRNNITKISGIAKYLAIEVEMKSQRKSVKNLLHAERKLGLELVSCCPVERKGHHFE